MTPNSVVKKGLQKLGVLAAGENLSGDETTDGIDLFNQMLHSWELQGVNLQHYDAASGDTLPYPQNHETAFVYGFAVYAAPEYEAQVPPAVAEIADRAFRALQNAYLDPNNKLVVDKALMPYYTSSYDISSDT